MSAWSDIEVELIVADYFSMLSDQSIGNQYSKAQHRRNLLPHLNNRSESSIEFKHQNISAVLISLGQPYIKGYLPRYNYQKILYEKVINYLHQNKSVENAFELFANKKIHLPPTDNFDHLLVDPPAMDQFKEPFQTYNRNPIKTNYLEREQRNTHLGALGEEFVFKYERWKLIQSGHEQLAKEVKWISREMGDGAGYDILSKQPNGEDKFIEVKTTKLGRETPFFFSSNELDFSIENQANYHLFRLFDFDQKAKMFVKQGGLDTICHSTPVSFKGFF